ncbi:hypothetical protein [Lysobacter gummosus]
MHDSSRDAETKRSRDALPGSSFLGRSAFIMHTRISKSESDPIYYTKKR